MKPGWKLPLKARRGNWLESCQLAPLLTPMIFSIVSTSAPAFTPNTKDSAMAAEMTPQRILFTILTTSPAPFGPTWKIFSFLPIASRTGRACSKISCSPPTMMVSVPLTAPCEPPLTGASRKCTPWVAANSPSLRLVAGAIVLMSIIISPLRAPARMPCSPVTTSSTSGELGSMVMTISESIATARGEGARFAPACKTSCTSAFSGWRAKIVTWWPALSRLRVMGRPMTPMPIKPICIEVLSLFHFDQHGPAFDDISLFVVDMPNLASVGGGDRVLHLHSGQDEQDLALLHLLAILHLHLHNGSGHRRGQGLLCMSA